jgi:Zinc finger, C3HC4 type (RING finger)
MKRGAYALAGDDEGGEGGEQKPQTPKEPKEEEGAAQEPELKRAKKEEKEDAPPGSTLQPATPGFWSNNADLPESMQIATLAFQKQALRARIDAAKEEKSDLLRELSLANKRANHVDAVNAAVATAWTALVSDLERLAGTAGAAVSRSASSSNASSSSSGDADVDMADSAISSFSGSSLVSSKATKAARGFVLKLLAAGTPDGQFSNSAGDAEADSQLAKAGEFTGVGDSASAASSGDTSSSSSSASSGMMPTAASFAHATPAQLSKSGELGGLETLFDELGELKMEDFERELARKLDDTKRIVERLVELLCAQGVERAQIAAEVRAVLDAVTDAAEDEIESNSVTSATVVSTTTTPSSSSTAVPSEELEEGEVREEEGSNSGAIPSTAGQIQTSGGGAGASASAATTSLPVAFKGLATELERLTSENAELRKQLDTVHIEKRGISKAFNAGRDRVTRALKVSHEAMIRAQQLSDELAHERQALVRTKLLLADAQSELQSRPAAANASSSSSSNNANSKELQQKKGSGQSGSSSGGGNGANTATATTTTMDTALVQKFEALQEMYESETQISAQREKAKQRLQHDVDTLLEENERLRNPREEDFSRFDFVRSLSEKVDRYRAAYERQVQQREAQVSQYKDELNPLAEKIADAWFSGQDKAFRDAETRLSAASERLAGEQRSATKLRRELDMLKSERRLADTLGAQRMLYEQLQSLVQKHSEEHSKLRTVVMKMSGSSSQEGGNVNVNVDQSELSQALAAEIDEVSTAFEQSAEVNAQLLSVVNEKESTLARHVEQGLKASQIESALRDESARLSRTVEASQAAHGAQVALVGELKLQLKNQSERVHALQRSCTLAAREQRESAVAQQQSDLEAHDLRAEVARLQKRLDQTTEQFQTSRAERTRATQERDTAREDLQRVKKTTDRYKRQAEAVGRGDTELLVAQVSELRRKVTCSICNDRDKDTVINRCFHVFCRSCVDRNLANRNRKCPTCKKGFDHNDIKHLWLDLDV